MLGFQSGFYSFLKSRKRSYIESFSLESNRDSIFPVFQPEDTTKSAFIIPAILPAFQYLDTGTVNAGKLLADLTLRLSFPAAAALIIAPYQTIFRYFRFISAVTLTMPVYRTFFISSVRWIQSGEISKTPACDILHSPAYPMAQAATASDFPGFQIT